MTIHTVAAVLALGVLLMTTGDAEPPRLDPLWSAIIAAIGGALSATSLLSKLVDWLRERSKSKADGDAKAAEHKSNVDVKAIDADLSIKQRLLDRIDTLERRNNELSRSTDDTQTKRLDLELRAANLDRAVIERDMVITEKQRLIDSLTHELKTRVREHETESTDRKQIIVRVVELERENLRLRAELESRDERRAATRGD